MTKEIMEGYVGVKFDAVCLGKNLPETSGEFIQTFRENGAKLLEYNMAPANGGNMSTRLDTGFLITASGANLGCIEDDEVVLVEDFFIEEKRVTYRGPIPPSSETFLHGLLYRENEKIQSVVHAHDEIATSMDLTGVLDETAREAAYGTVELARLCLETFKKGNDIIVLKNHGYVAVGVSLTQTTNTIIDMHRRLHQLKK